MSIDLELPPERKPTREEIERAIDAELKRRKDSKWADVSYGCNRFFIRSLRIAAGVGIALAAIWVFTQAVEILERPFASLSPLGLIGGLVAGFFGIGLTLMAFGAAFGEGESRQYYDARHEGELRLRIENELQSKEHQWE
jgi:hypothetical protein